MYKKLATAVRQTKKKPSKQRKQHTTNIQQNQTNMHKQKTCDTFKIQVMQRVYPSETVKHMLIIKMKLINTLLNDYSKRDNPTCLPYSRTQISVLFFNTSHNYEKDAFPFCFEVKHATHQNVCIQIIGF